MILNQLRELDLVLLRNNQLYIVLVNNSVNCLALFNTNFSCENIICDWYDDDMTHIDGKSNLDIIAVMRSKTAWYTLNRFHEYEEALKNGQDMNIFLNRKSWKWIWKREDSPVDVGLLEYSLYDFNPICNHYIGAKSGAKITKITNQILESENSNWDECKYLTKEILTEFKNKYIDGEFAINPNAYYILIITSGHGLIAKKVSDTDV